MELRAVGLPVIRCIASSVMLWGVANSGFASSVCPIPSAGISGDSTLCLSFDQTASGVSSSGNTNALSNPGTYVYGNSYSSSAGGTPITGSPTGAGFYDDYVFSITGGSADSLTATLNLGGLYDISNLATRLFAEPSSYTGPIFGPVTGQINGVVQGNTVVIPTTTLAAGTYVLEVSGTAAGTVGGSYSGILNLAPVPLPPAVALLLPALVGLGGMAYRRRGATGGASTETAIQRPRPFSPVTENELASHSSNRPR